MPEQTQRDAAEELKALALRHTAVFEKGFAIDLRGETPRWCRAIRALGEKRAYRLISETLCALYESRFGTEYLFSEACVAFEIAYHANAYFWTQGYSGFRRDPTTLLFSREELERHCRVVDISTDDTAIRRQRLMFGYARGVRPGWRGTERDPFDRSTWWRRLTRRRK